MWWVEHGGRGCRLAGLVLIKQSIALLGWFTITIETMRRFGCINITIYCPPLLMVILKWPNYGCALASYWRSQLYSETSDTWTSVCCREVVPILPIPLTLLLNTSNVARGLCTMTSGMSLSSLLMIKHSTEVS